MATYEIVPLTTSLDQPYNTIENVDLGKCRSICSSDDDCVGYLYNYPPDKKGERSCSFFNKKLNKTGPSQNSSLYIKKENHSFWILWLFLACLFFIIFFSRCNKKRF